MSTCLCVPHECHMAWWLSPSVVPRLESQLYSRGSWKTIWDHTHYRQARLVCLRSLDCACLCWRQAYLTMKSDFSPWGHCRWYLIGFNAHTLFLLSIRDSPDKSLLALSKLRMAGEVAYLAIPSLWGQRQRWDCHAAPVNKQLPSGTFCCSICC